LFSGYSLREISANSGVHGITMSRVCFQHHQSLKRLLKFIPALFPPPMPEGSWH
ncbi:hypothetical protein PISMIDRAFT_115852, partial [Pisolithus microcarpus 441]